MARRGLLVVLVALLAGCAPASPTSSAPSATPALRAALTQRFPVLDGSTTAYPLARLIACDLYAVPCVWNAPVSANKERNYVPDPSAGIADAMSQKILAIKFNTTHNGYVNLIEGKADAILEARAPSSDETSAAAAKGVELDVTPIALDGFVFLAHSSNPVDSLPLDTIRGIYSGRINTWKQAGVTLPDPAAAIHPFQRERNSGSQEQLQQTVMNGEKVIDAPEMIVATMLGPFNAIGGDPTTGAGGDKLGFGYTFYYYFTVMFANPNVKVIGVDGIKPSAQTLSSKTYPLTSPVYVVTRKGSAADSPGMQFRSWILSPDGQRLIKQSGYVPLSGQ